MKKIQLLIFLALLPMFAHAQFWGIGAQYSQGGDGQFVHSISFPTFHKKNSINSFISSGLEITTSGKAPISGLNIKPIQLQTFFSENLFNNFPVTFLLGVDGGYNFDFRAHKKNGIILTPNLYVDYRIFFIKSGWDFDVSHGHNQFFVRAGLGVGLGIFKSLAKTKIW